MLAERLGQNGVPLLIPRFCRLMDMLVSCRLQRALQGAEWCAERLKPVFQGGLIVVLEGRTLLTIPSTQLAEVCVWADWGATCGLALHRPLRRMLTSNDPTIPWRAGAV